MKQTYYKAIVIEDEPKDLQLLLTILKQFDKIEVIDSATDVEGAIAAIAFHKPDLVFFDIDLYGRTAFEALNRLIKYKLNPVLIFTTAHPGFMKEAFKYAAFEYLLKPIDPDDLGLIVNRLDEIQKNNNLNSSVNKFVYCTNKLIFNTHNGFILIDPEDIAHIQAEEGYSDIFLVDNTKKTVSKKIGEIENMLANQMFVRIHRSTIINIQQFKEIVKGKNNFLLYFKTLAVPIEISRSTVQFIKSLYV